ncbi:30S ribosomal protein S15 [Candidatus Woesearchaeota archaeon]|jgi:small subunit ribosomal protein S15|nr:30S ribosomal protein S15 [Candidatus Woesearchaeota archaeon]MBT6044538.1 30S ribosomal protein S15 [Candidatus Woesearchaeota archaeon]
MARRYSKKKGVSGSTRPVNVDNSAWVNKDVKAVTDVIVELAKAGKSASQIGIVLRDSYAVPDVKEAFGKSIGTILTEGGIKKEVPDDLLSLIRRDIAIAKHIESNKKDMTAKRGQQLTLSKINKLVGYYKATSVLSADWTYDRSKAMQWIV